jgi:cytochrome c
MRHSLLAVLAVAISVPLSISAWAEGDAAAGKTQFDNVCSLCHSAEKGVNKLGPSLFGVYGRKSASLPDYSYSDAVKSLNVTWDDATLDKWLTNPRDMASGTKMIFPGVSDAKQRQDVIAYLKTLK